MMIRKSFLLPSTKHNLVYHWKKNGLVKQQKNSGFSSLSKHFLDELSSLENVVVSENKYELERHGRGEDYHESIPPQAIVMPSTTKATSEIAKLCTKYEVPMIPFGTGTSLEGHVAALKGGISIDTSLLDTIELSQEQDFHATVGAGCTRLKLNDALRHTGLTFTVDPGADASIGGMVACGASGTTTVKYGTVRENILALEVVLPDGSIASTGSLARKSSAGYDLTSLMCGSEGTLGIITKVTVKLQPIPEYVSAAVCSFTTLHEAAEAVTTIRQLGIDVTRLELLDATSITAFNHYSPNVPDLPEQPHLFLEFSGASETSVTEQASLAEQICKHEYNAGDFSVETSEEARKRLWAARHVLYYASIALRPGASHALITDACVPLSSFADILQQTANDVKELQLIATCFGHAGDGNFHCILPTLPDDSLEYTKAIRTLSDRLIDRTLAVGGTCTGEHGVGYGKIKYLQEQYKGSATLAMMKLIKNALDPLNIMNPGKILS